MPATTLWFTQKMREIGHLEPPKACEFLEIFPEPRNVIPQWYRDLLQAARAYVQTGGILSVSPKPHKGAGWIARSAIKEALRNKADTYSLE